MSLDPARCIELGRLAERLVADCNDNFYLLRAVDALTIPEGEILDLLAFRCTSCEKWLNASERVGIAQWICRQCDDGSV